MLFTSRRSTVFGLRGIVATSQPLASEAGMRVLQQGGNAADAAIAAAAVLNVTEPGSTGIGGDCFALFYDANSQSVKGLNGSGRSPASLTIEKLAEVGVGGSMPVYSAHAVTVPGAAAGWVDTLDRFGTFEIAEILAPAIELAEGGFPVAPISAYAWQRSEALLQRTQGGQQLLKNGKAPRAGELMKMPNLAATFRELAEHGKAGFYEGRVATAIVKLLQSMGGQMIETDLKNHTSSFVDPISVNYRGIDVHEIPPNGQGLTALIALNILEEFDIAALEHNSRDYLHLLIEAMRIAFADTRWFVADPEVTFVPTNELLSKTYAARRRALIDLKRATLDTAQGSPTSSSDTVYLSVVDGDGNACSFINSNYMGFGTALVPEGCGFTLQNRGVGFSLNPEHPNALAPEKRPYHTIIPAMATEDDELWASFGVMGGFMQPQGHVQVLANMIDHGMQPQAALDVSRFCIKDGTSGGNVSLEEGISPKTVDTLRSMGHAVDLVKGHERALFGRGQIIRRDSGTGILSAGSDPRADGMAIAW